MYERIDARDVLTAGVLLTEALRSRGVTGILLRHGAKLTGKLWRHGGACRLDSVFVPLGEMLAALRAVTRVTLARFGDRAFRQRTGMMIGGPMSDLGPGLLLAAQEAAWRTVPRLRAAAGWEMLQDAAQCRDSIAAARYVDDLILISRKFCPECLVSYGKSSHVGVPFNEEARAGAGPVQWLDAVVFAGGWPVHIEAARPETDWLTGVAALPGRYRVAPWLGGGRRAESEVYGHARGRLSRWSQMRTGRAELARNVLYDLLVLWRSAYPPAWVGRVWCDAARGHEHAEFLRKFVSMVCARAAAVPPASA